MKFIKMFDKTFFNISNILLIWLVLVTPITKGWLLAQLGLNETYRVRHLSTHFTRVFLSITVDSRTFPSLIESRWPVRYAPLRAAVFPNMAAHNIGKEEPNCQRILRAIWTQVDGLNRLWVMDIGGSHRWEQQAPNGTINCKPKLIVFDLLRDNAEVLRIDCSRYISTDPAKLLAIKLGPPPVTPLTQCQAVEKYVYMLRADDSHILAYDIIEQRWQQRLLVSRKYENLTPEILPIKPIDIAFAGMGVDTQKYELLISDVDGALYGTSNALLLQTETGLQQQQQQPQAEDEESQAQPNAIKKVPRSNSTSTNADIIENLKMEYLGSLLGPSRGMMVDHMQVLYYVVPKFGAVVRCSHYRRNLTAEGNEIIYMTSKNIQQIFFGSEDSVWLVTDRVLQPNDHCFAGLT